MDQKIITELSKKYLKQIFQKINEENLAVRLCGGWAVHFLLKKKGVTHLESRDIDLFFDPEKTKKEAIVQLLEDLGFKAHSTFRWAKYLDYDTQKELTSQEAKTQPLHDLITYFVDLLPTKHLEGDLFHEPLLEPGLGTESYEHDLDGIIIRMPTERVMIQVKTRSSIEREKSDKRVKDLADLYNLLEHEERIWMHNTEGERETTTIPENLKKEFTPKLEEWLKDGTLATTGSTLPDRTTTEQVYTHFEKAYSTKENPSN